MADTLPRPQTIAAPRMRGEDLRRIAATLACVAVLGVAVWLRDVLPAGSDVASLLTAGEAMLDGAKLYADIVEANPPMAVLAYLPGIMIARALHLAPELVTDALVFLAIAVSLGMSVRILRSSRAMRDIPCALLAPLAALVLAVLPMQAFGQREHIALIAALPFLALTMRRAVHDPVTRGWIVVAGVGAATTMAFKPHFALAFLFACLASSILARSWRCLVGAECWIAAAGVALYGAMVATLFPEFLTDVLPMVRDIYVRVTWPWAVMAANTAVVIWIVAAVACGWLMRARQERSFVAIAGAASAGFACAYLIQRKGWPYQSYPMIALALLALGVAVFGYLRTSSDRVMGGALIALLAMLGVLSGRWFDDSYDSRPLERPVASLGARPKILLLSSEAAIGHTLVRALNGSWVSRQQALWITAYANRLRAQGPIDSARDARLTRYAAQERAHLVADFSRAMPDIVLFDERGDEAEWLADAQIQRLLSHYRLSMTVNHIAIMKRIE